MKTIKLALLYGGNSPEHEVSVRSAFSIIREINYGKYSVEPIYINPQGVWFSNGIIKEPPRDIDELMIINNKEEYIINNLKHFDVVFPVLHGENGEDGTIQGVLELLNVPYVGNGVLASAAGIDKVFMKKLFSQQNIPQVDYIWFEQREWKTSPPSIIAEINSTIGYPCFIKPARLGSSVGITKCQKEDELKKAIQVAFSYDSKIVIEKGVKAREIEIGILGNDELQFSVVGEIIHQTGEFYDYEAKYKSTKTQLIVPAEIDDSLYENIVNISEKCYKALECTGLVRADFFVADLNEIYINEINTLPGFTTASMFPILWEKSGLPYVELIDLLIQLALEKTSL